MLDRYFLVRSPTTFIWIDDDTGTRIPLLSVVELVVVEEPMVSSFLPGSTPEGVIGAASCDMDSGMSCGPLGIGTGLAVSILDV